ncbi:MAG: NAD(P)-binding domain-containing protein, partial [Acidimicrobiales bacterium]
MRIGILGSTGPAGTALGARLASVGYEVILGSRSLERATQARDALLEQWPTWSLALDASDNEGTAAGGEIVVVATPWDSAAPTAGELERHLSGKVVICMANALVRVGREFQPLVLPRGSVAA